MTTIGTVGTTEVADLAVVMVGLIAMVTAAETGLDHRLVVDMEEADLVELTLCT